jgi:Glycosyl hydrolase catalytic core
VRGGRCGPVLAVAPRRSRLVAVLALGALLVACGSRGDAAPAAVSHLKRGVAYDLRSPADLAAVSRGATWWYDWGLGTSAPAGYHATYGLEFVPMLWGRNTSQDVANLEAFVLAHPEVRYVLVMNEPNLTDQANRTPAQAAGDWLVYEGLKASLAGQGRSIQLVGPAMTWGTMPGYADPVVWLDAFYLAFQQANGRDPEIDHLAFHWYDYGLAAQLDRLQKYGKPIWVTEFANWHVGDGAAAIDSAAKQLAQLQAMVDLCESRSDVFRYAWFTGRWSPDPHFTSLFEPGEGQLTALGVEYLERAGAAAP